MNITRLSRDVDNRNNRGDDDGDGDGDGDVSAIIKAEIIE